jgi:hypothetical protein
MPKPTPTRPTPAELGRRAYRRGLPNAPALDPEFFVHYLSGPVSDDHLAALREWQRGWWSAPLRAAVGQS